MPVNGEANGILEEEEEEEEEEEDDEEAFFVVRICKKFKRRIDGQRFESG
jgi:hypothetical protein